MAADKNRINFLSSFRNSRQGAYEDPTYFGFKIFFVFDDKTIDGETGLPDSPLFVDSAYNDIIDRFGISGLKGSGQGASAIAFHSAQSYLISREAGFTKKRADILNQFKSLLRQVNNQTPWFFQSIKGLDKLASVAKPGYGGVNSKTDGSFSPYRTYNKSLTIDCLESLNIRITALAELYRQATFDYEYMRELVPRNLRKFKMYIYVSEVRNFNKTNRLSGASTSLRSLESTSNLLTNGMNPGNSIGDSGGQIGNSIPEISKNSTVSDILNKSGVSNDFNQLANQTDQAGITPFLVFECSQCEFDFDSSTPITDNLENGSGNASAATQSFKIYVDRVRTRIQMPNIRDDANFLILSDGYDQSRSSFKKVDRQSAPSTNGLTSSLIQGGEDLLTNFVGNSVNDLINTQVNRLSRILSGPDSLLLGNVYSFSPGAIVNRPSFDSVSQLADQFRNGLDLGSTILGGGLPNSQSNGQGGPPERVYPSPSGDVYSNVPGGDLGVPDRVYPAPRGDVYQNVPGSDLGVPERQYLQPTGDVYENVPGSDLGGIDRIYKAPVGDVYENVPGSDLGLPDRAYPAPIGDFYPDSPGTDLGVPDRIYPAPNEDVYATSPGRDLGVPDRIYPPSEGDVYLNSPGTDLGVPDRIYPKTEGDVYPTVPGRDLGVPDRQYGLDKTTVYTDPNQSSQSNTLGSLYEFQPSVGDTLNSRVYEQQMRDNGFDSPPPNQYGTTPTATSPREMGSLYPTTFGDFSPEVTSLGNLKPFDRYNFSLDDVNGIDED
jgi:hypothetical protein